LFLFDFIFSVLVDLITSYALQLGQETYFINWKTYVSKLLLLVLFTQQSIYTPVVGVTITADAAMPRCEGLPTGPYPKNVTNRSVKNSQGDFMMLCKNCEDNQFPPPPSSTFSKVSDCGKIPMPHPAMS